MVDNLDTVEFRTYVLEVGFRKGYKVYTEYPEQLAGKTRPIDVVFIKGDERHYIEIESGGESGTSYAPEGRERDVKLAAKGTKGFVLTKNERGKRLHIRTKNSLTPQQNYKNVVVLTWDEYKKQANKLHYIITSGTIY